MVFSKYTHPVTFHDRHSFRANIRLVFMVNFKRFGVLESEFMIPKTLHWVWQREEKGLVRWHRLATNDQRTQIS